MTNGDDITKLAGIETLKNALPPLIAVNTTAGTGSELTRHCVITNEETHYKFVVASWRNMPLVSFNDPTLMLDVPKGLTAATGMDAFVQAIEPFVSVDHNPITDSQCIQAIKLIETSLREAVANGHNLEARTHMVEAEMLAGMAFNNANLGYVHAMAHQLGGFYNLPHGECNAILLPIVEEYNLLAHLDKFINIARMMDENIDGLSKRDAAELAISAIRRLSQDVGIPASITELAKRYGKEVSRSDIPTMVANAQKDACGLTNPRKMTDAAVQQLYEIAF